MANECRRVCGVTRRPGSKRPAYCSTIARMSRGERLPLAVEEQRRSVLTRHGRPSGRQVGVQRVHGVIRHRNLALLDPLPAHEHTPAIEVDLHAGETRDLPDAQARPVQQLEDGSVAERNRPLHRIEIPRRPSGRCGRFGQCGGLAGSKDAGSRFTTFGRPSNADGSLCVSPVRGPSDKRCGSCRRVGRSTRARSPGCVAAQGNGGARGIARSRARSRPASGTSRGPRRHGGTRRPCDGEMPFVAHGDEASISRTRTWGSSSAWGVTGSFRVRGRTPSCISEPGDVERSSRGRSTRWRPEGAACVNGRL